MDEFNPYQAPSTDVAPQGRRSRWRWNGAFMVIFLVNLFVPGFLAEMISQDTALVGIVIGIAVMFLFGSWICAQGRMVALIFVRGSALVALSQIAFFPQVMAGFLAIRVASALGITNKDGKGIQSIVDISLGSCVVTIFTGAILMLAAATIGLILRLITPARWWLDGDQPPRG